jgi:2-dehydropantoate 2-reductase
MAAMGDRVLIVGCGGIGGIVAAHLSGHPPEVVERLVPLSRNTEIADAVCRYGFRLRGVDGERTVPGRVVSEIPDDAGLFDWVLLATQPPQVEEAVAAVKPHLAADGVVVCFQNGLCEDRVARIIGPERVLGAIVAWGATVPEPGVFERTAHGGFTVGSVGRPAPGDRLRRLAVLLEPIGPVEIADDLAGYRWSKLALNCAISSLGTIGGRRLGPLLARRFVRRLALEIMTEVVVLARAEEIPLRKVSGTLDLDWLALSDDERASRASASLVAKHSLLLAVGTRYRRMRSSMLYAIERGRPPAVDFLNGEIMERAARHDIDVPFNAEARRLVHAIAVGEEESGWRTLANMARGLGVRVEWADEPAAPSVTPPALRPAPRP